MPKSDLGYGKKLVVSGTTIVTMVFAEAFHASCKEEKQTQSFSGVGAQCQNAEAECTIQAVTSVKRSFMIHAAMNWGED